ncbi:MAG: cobalamin-binding protein [Micromonosporaceae bacterium]|nr:cobalamin-binding protein [Micromonosporaceae bacterium]
MRDDLGEPHDGAPRRVVSLVPSLTEAVAVTAPELLVGATDWCSHPADLDVPRVGGTKYPKLDRVLACEPDLVLANAEENRREDVAALRESGVPVWVTYPRTLDEAFASLGRMFAALGVSRPGWLDAAAAAWAAPHGGARRRAAVPVWRRPWVVLGGDTFAGDVLRALGVDNIYGDSAERYPRPALDEILQRRPDLVVLPDEPYRFTADDGPEAFGGVPCALVSGRHLTWYGPSLAEARTVLERQLA